MLILKLVARAVAQQQEKFVFSPNRANYGRGAGKAYFMRPEQEENFMRMCVGQRPHNYAQDDLRRYEFEHNLFGEQLI